ncbi:hypothetical protein D3C76_1043410 [compost metagenome]
MSNVWDCEYYQRCKRSTDCLMCGPDKRLLTLPEDKGRKQHRAKAVQNTVTSVTNNTGATLEDYVRDNLNNVPTIREYWAKRQAGSGNIWFMPGDVADTVLLAECKERLETNSKGEKQITITKLMLDKITGEAKMLSKYPALPFRIKGDDKTYIINEFGVLCEMVHEIKVLRHENQVVAQERDMWKDAAGELHKENQRLLKDMERLRKQWEEKDTEWD